ncbi:MAG: DMT family transporter, partial [Spirochaetia bacterium]|nr:DMT family transporter [Spirochaetia bacterium]
RGEVDPVTLSVLRFSIGGLVLWVIGLLVSRRKKSVPILPGDWFRLAGLGFFGMLGMSGLLFWGQTCTTAVNASMIMQTSPLLIFVGGILLGEKSGALRIFGILTGFIGCLIMMGILTPRGLSFQAGHLAGDGLIIGAALCWAIYSLWGKSLVARLGGLTTTTWAMILGALELFILRIFLPSPFHWPTGAVVWTQVLYLAILPTALAFFAWYEAMNLIPLTLLNVMQYLTPVFTILLAWLILNETLSAHQWIGISLICLGVVAAEIKVRKKN